MDNATTPEPGATGSFQRLLPPDLVKEVARTHGNAPKDMEVTWQPSLIGRFLELFAGRGPRG